MSAAHAPVDALLAGAAVRLDRAEDTAELGSALGRLLRPGDLVLLTGDLAAGKTTLTQGIGAGMRVRGPVTSPTFVLARVHPSLVGGPALVHVDAYRLGGLSELDDLDLDASLEESVTVVEWGHGLAEGLAENRLELVLEREAEDAGDEATGDAGEEGRGTTGDGPRVARATGHGPRWAGLG